MSITRELKKGWARFFANAAIASLVTGVFTPVFSGRFAVELVIVSALNTIILMGLSSLIASFILEERNHDA